MPITERHELISHLDQLGAILRTSKDTLHREVLASVSNYLKRRLGEVSEAEIPTRVQAVSRF
jgi:hypothetical protein